MSQCTSETTDVDTEERAPWADFVGYPDGDLVEVWPNAWFDGPDGLEFERSSGGRSYACAIEGN